MAKRSIVIWLCLFEDVDLATYNKRDGEENVSDHLKGPQWYVNSQKQNVIENERHDCQCCSTL